MHYWMYDVDNPRRGEGGPGCSYVDENGEEAMTDEDEPIVGRCVKVYSLSRWWRTSTVTEILTREQKAKNLEITFKTHNSIYRWVRSS